MEGWEMAGQTSVQTEVYRDRFGVLLENKQRSILELQWLDTSRDMSEEDFKAWLSRFAGEAEARRPSFLMIDIRQFGHRPGEGFASWRDQFIVPRYNRAGVTKFAMLVPSGASGWLAPGQPPTPEPPGTFPTGYFADRDQMDTWFGRG
jgi:hypothetical protein